MTFKFFIKKIFPVAYENNNENSNEQFAENNYERNNESIFSKRLKAGKRRTYFFDVRSTRGNDYFVTLTESKKRFNDNGYDRHKIFLYKEDFNKFLSALTETIDHVKTELMPDYDFDAFKHEYEQEENTENTYKPNTEIFTEQSTPNRSLPMDTGEAPDPTIEVDKW